MITIIFVIGCGSAFADKTKTTVENVLGGYIKALGGRTALETLSIRICEGRFIDDRPYRGPVSDTPCLVRAKAGRACEVVMNGNARVEGSSITGERHKLSWLLDPQGPLTLTSDFPNLRYEGNVLVDGKSAHKLVSDRDPDHYALYFDVASGLLVRIGHYLTIGDYHEVDGVMVPHRITNSRKGGSNTWMFERIHHE